MIEEDHLIAEATGNPPVADTEMMLAAWRGREPEASELIEATVQEATARGLGRLASFATYASSVLYNGLGRHDAARDAARQAFERDQLGYGPLVVPELAEAAARTGDVALVRAALEWLSERTRVKPTDWALGIEARVRALLSEGEAADSLLPGVDRPARPHPGPRRARPRPPALRRVAAPREPAHRRPRAAADGPRDAGRDGHRGVRRAGPARAAGHRRDRPQAHRLATRRRTLTAQEAQVARLARDGLSNPEIGARLFISSRTVQYHLRKVFTKLGISSRSQLYRVLPSDPASASLR